jgi:hypothetical protein
LTEKNELALLKAENDRLAHDLEKLRQRLKEDIARTQAGVRLDLNLEKGRMREDASGQELKIKEVDARIEQEIANLRTSIQASKATTLQYLVGFGEWNGHISLYSTYDFCSHWLLGTPHGISPFPIIIPDISIYPLLLRTNVSPPFPMNKQR